MLHDKTPIFDLDPHLL